MYNIFVSHYTEEKPIAQDVHDLLEVTYNGFAEVFISSDIPVGTNWLRDIKTSLSISDEILSIFTHKSADRPWINIETGYGIMAEKVVTPILFAGYSTNDLHIIYHLQKAVDSRLKNDVTALYSSILARIRMKYPTARPKWDQDEFWQQWSNTIPKAEALSPVTPLRSGEYPIVWLIGSHSHLEHEHDQQKALQVCQTLARSFMAARIQIVMGTSRMLDYLADSYIDYLEEAQNLANAKGEPWRKTLATEHAQSTNHAPNPIILLGSLRKVSIRELFNETIGRFPDIAILIGGRKPEKSGRAAEEIMKAVEAEIPVLPIKFTGGAASVTEPSTHPSLKNKVAELQTLTGNVDKIGPLIIEIIKRQSEIQRVK